MTRRGVLYVTELSKRRLYPLTEFGERCMKTTVNLRQIVLSMDSIGIRRIQLVAQDSEPTSDGSPWYKVLDVSISKSDIIVDYGGSLSGRYVLSCSSNSCCKFYL
jgi:hypothetical protein